MKTFAIRKAFLIPLGILLLQCLALVVLCVVNGEPKGKIIILGVIILPIAILFLESAFRRVLFDDRGLTVFKLLRNKEFRFSEITAVETIQVRKRAFLTLSAGDDFLIISNAYASFPALVATLLAKVPQGAVSEETKAMAAAPPVKSTDVISCWLGVALLALILYIQLGGRL